MSQPTSLLLLVLDNQPLLLIDSCPHQGSSLGIGLFLIATAAVWSRPLPAESRGAKTISWLLTIFFVVLWCLWVAGFDGLLWIGIYAILLPRVLSISTQALEAFPPAELRAIRSKWLSGVVPGQPPSLWQRRRRGATGCQQPDPGASGPGADSRRPGSAGI